MMWKITPEASVWLLESTGPLSQQGTMLLAAVGRGPERGVTLKPYAAIRLAGASDEFSAQRTWRASKGAPQ